MVTVKFQEARDFGFVPLFSFEDVSRLTLSHHAAMGLGKVYLPRSIASGWVLKLNYLTINTTN